MIFPVLKSLRRAVVKLAGNDLPFARLRMMDESVATSALLERAEAGDRSALGELIQQHRQRLTRVVAFRLDRRMRGRIDAADVVQEAFLDATSRFGEYLAERKMPFFLWLRFLTLQKLCELHRSHFGVKARDVTREVSLQAGTYPEATSVVLANQLLGKYTTPSQVAVRAEIKRQLEQALNEMDTIDREIVALRNFEQLSNVETARILEISESAASNRYIRAIKRLRKILDRDESCGETRGTDR